MATVRSTFTLDDAVAAQARHLGINVSAAARRGVIRAIRDEQARRDRDAYLRYPEKVEDLWESSEGWEEA